jgi:hypothetical protein
VSRWTIVRFTELPFYMVERTMVGVGFYEVMSTHGALTSTARKENPVDLAKDLSQLVQRVVIPELHPQNGWRRVIE